MYQLILFLFYIRVFQILGSRCSLFFVTFVFCPLDLCTKILCKFSWNFDIQIICNLDRFFWVARTNSFYFGFTLEYFELWRAAIVYFCNLHIISFAVRYRENSHGISKFKSFGTYSMTFNLDNKHFFSTNKL